MTADWGTCPVCRALYRLRADGCVRRHRTTARRWDDGRWVTVTRPCPGGARIPSSVLP